MTSRSGTLHPLAAVAGWPVRNWAASLCCAASIGASVLLASCGDSTPTSTSSNETMAVYSGDNQVAVFGTMVAIPPAVKVIDENQQPVAGVTVTFTIPATTGNPGLTAATPTTGADGVAAVGSWKLGDVGGQELTATAAGVHGSPVTFSATAVNVQTAAVQAGTNQTAVAGQSVAIAPAIVVTDVFAGTPTPGVTVTFAVTQGGGTLTAATATTDVNGIATVGSWTLGPTPGTNRVSATVALVGVAAVPFTATGTASIRR